MLCAAVIGCSSSDEEDGGKTPSDQPTTVRPNDLAAKTFTFTDGAVLDSGLSGRQTELAFGNISNTTGPFTLTADGISASGTATVNSCRLEVTASDFPVGRGPQVGAKIDLDPCTLAAATGNLVLTNADTGVAARSEGGGEPVAQAFPRHGIGTYWTFTQDSHHGSDIELNLRVTGRRGYRGREVLVIKGEYSEGSETLLHDAETGNQVAYLDDDGSGQEYDPHDGQVSFPLKVGKIWRATYTERYSHYVGFEAGPLERVWEEREVWEDWEVVAYERVTVPAGTFMAFRVTRTGSSCDIDPNCSQDEITYWYAPDVGFWVKFVSSYDTETSVSELTEWELVPEIPAPVVQGPVMHEIGASWAYDFTNVNTGTEGTFDLAVQGRREHRGRQVLAFSRASNPDVYPEDHPEHGCDTNLTDAETGNLVACLRGGQVLVEFVPYYGNLNFPMELGKTWRSTYEYIDHVNNFTGEFWGEFRVFAYEEITVNGTAFMAYGVTRTDGSVDGYYETYWYAPEIGRAVKADYGGLEFTLVE